MAAEFSIVDSHVHLWDPARFRMPWLDELPTLRRPYSWTDFAEQSRGLPIDQIVYVQVDATDAYGLLEARWACAQNVGGVVAFAPIDDGRIVTSYLEALKDLGPRIKGVRRILQDEPDISFVCEPAFLEGLRLLPAYQLSFDICIRHHQLGAVVEMVRACPEVQFILDHLGKPDVRGHVLEPWRSQLAQLGALPNVVCKVSGLVTEADPATWTVEDVAPYVAHALQTFGEDRVLFGGDWPVLTQASTYARWVEALDSLTRDLSDAARGKLWAHNARRVYRLV